MEREFLAQFSIRGYRSLDEPCNLSNIGRLNVLIGQNNSGKSNILRFISKFFPTIFQSHIDNIDYDLFPSDKPERHSTAETALRIWIKKDSPVVYQLLLDLAKRLGEKPQTQPENIKEAIERLFSKSDSYQFEYRWSKDREWDHQHSDHIIKDSLNINDERIFQASQRLITQNNLSTVQNGVNQIISALNPSKYIIGSTALIPAIRSTSSGLGGIQYEQATGMIRNGDFDHSGSGLIGELHRWQHPDRNNNQDKMKFAKITKFLRDLTGDLDAIIEIPHDQTEIVVETDGRRLPLAALGTGIEQIIILASKCTIFNHHIICLEEPEQGIHPTLQRKLMDYLLNNTNNQYFISTHSSSFIDMEDINLYHVEKHEGYSKVTPAINPHERFSVCRDLGYRASDILQTNAIIWVEGPSDRIYLNNWLSQLSPELKEGSHYSVMFYGGRLLNHLSATDSEVDEFISLLRINRNTAIVIDSDRARKGQKINSTKQRIRKELESIGGLCWVTMGREIENYIDHASMVSAIQEVHPNSRLYSKIGAYEHYPVYWVSGRRSNTSVRKADKVKIARKIASHTSFHTQLDLQERISEVVQFIRTSNHWD